MIEKDAYNRFHVAIGTSDPPAFERLSSREQRAWFEVADGARYPRELVEDLRSQIRRLEQDLSNVESRKSKIAAELDAARSKRRPKKAK